MLNPVQGRYYDPVRDIFIVVPYNQPAEQPVQPPRPVKSTLPPALPALSAANTKSPLIPLLRGMFFPNFYVPDIPAPLQQSDFCPGFGGISIASFNSDTDPRNFRVPYDWGVVSAAKPFVDLLGSTQCAVGPYRMQPIQLLSEILWEYKRYNSVGGVSWVLDFVLKASDKAPRFIRDASTEEEFSRICAYPPNFCQGYWKAVLRIGVCRESLGYSEPIKALETLGDHMRFKPLVVESILPQ